MYDKETEFEKAWTVMNDFGGGNTLHGMEKKEIRIERRCLQVNYVTFKTDWKVD